MDKIVIPFEQIINNKNDFIVDNRLVTKFTYLYSNKLCYFTAVYELLLL